MSARGETAKRDPIPACILAVGLFLIVGVLRLGTVGGGSFGPVEPVLDLIFRAWGL